MRDPTRIFISYRRDDTAGYARAIADGLARHWGERSVFIDVDDIGPGQAFADAIGRAVGACRALVVLIGPRWRGRPAGAPARWDDAGDFVRSEVSAALAAGMHVIPVLLDGATMPTAAELPEPMRALAGRHAIEIRHARFAADLAVLVEALRAVVGDTAVDDGDGDRAGAAVHGGDPTAAAETGGAAAASTGDVGTAVARRRPSRRQVAAAVAAVAAAVLAAAVAVTRPWRDHRPAFDGRWVASVVYDWGARHRERFDFAGSGDEVHGTATFLGVPRAIVDGRVDDGGLRFVTRTDEQVGADAPPRRVVHRYRARLVGDDLQVVMQTDGSASPHPPLTFVARRWRGAAREP